MLFCYKFFLKNSFMPNFNKLQNKMSAIIGVLLLFLAIYFGISTHTNQTNTQLLERTETVTYPLLQAADSSLLIIEKLRESLNAAAGTKEVEEIEKADAHAQRILANFNLIAEKDALLSTQVMELTALFNSYYDEARATSLAVAKGEIELATATSAIMSFNARSAKFEEELKAFRSVQYTTFTNQIRTSSEGSIYARNLGIGLMALSLICFAILNGILKAQVVTPIKQLAENSQKVAHGEYPPEITPNSKDEISVLCKNFADMTRDIQKNQENLKQISILGRILSSASSLVSIRELVQSSFNKIAERDLKIKVYFTERCFVGRDLEAGLYTINQENIPYPAEINSIDLLAKDYALTILVKDPLTDSPLAAIGVHGLNVEKIAESLKALATNVANAISQIRLTAAMSLIEQQSAESKTILESVTQGICLINENMVLQGQYSKHLEHILNDSNLKGKNLNDLLLKKSNISSDLRSQIEAAIDNIVGQDILGYDINRVILPRELTVEGKAEDRYFEIDWIPIANSDGVVQQMVTTIRDVTEVKQYRVEEQKRRDELVMVDEILAQSPEEFAQGIDGLITLGDSIALSIGSLANLKSDAQRILARDVHTFKGNARSLGLSFIADGAHEFETILFQLFEGREELQDINFTLELKITEIAERLKRYQELYETKIANRQGGSIELSNMVANLNSLLGEWESKVPIHSHDLVAAIRAIVAPSPINALKMIIERCHKGLVPLARENGTPLPELKVSGNESPVLNPMGAAALTSVLNHLMRNAYDHGVKNEKDPKIFCDFEISNDNSLKLSFFDNGPGLNLQKLDLKGQSLGFVKAGASDQAIANLIFANGLSTTSEVTSISGRGVGLDAVKAIVDELGGGIQVEFTTTERLSGYRKFKFLINLPPTILDKSGTINGQSAA